MHEITINCIGNHITISYAAAELKNYLERISGEKAIITSRESYDPSEKGALWIGLTHSFPGLEVVKVEDSIFDDAVYIKVKAKEGIIAGINRRSVLLGVYRYLTELGCRWVRPGTEGEFIPKLALADTFVEVTEAASYRHRGICIEGAVSYEHVRDIIQWAPRVGLNGYYIQFREAYTFFDRWYSHLNNPLKEPEGFSLADARRLVAMAVDEIKKRDLIYHGVGHGWTCEPFGLEGLSWDPVEVEIKPEVAQYLALVNGERKLWKGVPLNTNLCYSNPEVRRVVTEEIANYIQTYPEIDIMHFWLADGSNNQCECERCCTARPSDFYVQMLNELDELLSERGLDTKIVFLIYVDLLWAPEKNGIKNPDRFILMFAPITRAYIKPFTPEKVLPKVPPYERNRLSFAGDVGENIAFLRSWQDIFQGDSFDFDYHFMWEHYKDPGYIQIAEIMHKDIQNLEDIGLNGFISCQTQRSFFPTGLGVMLMGWTLWNKQLTFEEIAKEYFDAAFGLDGRRCYSYLRSLSELFDPSYLRGSKLLPDEAMAQSFAKIPQVIEDFKPIIERNIDSDDTCHAASWRYLKEHAYIYQELAQALEMVARDNLDAALEKWELIKKRVQEREDLLHPVLDVWLFIRTLGTTWFAPKK